MTLLDLLAAAIALLLTSLGATLTARQACERAAGVLTLSDLPRPGCAAALADALDLLAITGPLGRGRAAAERLALLAPGGLP